MSEPTQEQKLQESVVLLKARLFDVQEQAGAIKAQADEYAGALSEIAAAVGVTGESVMLIDIIKAVKALVPEQSELELKPE